MRPLAFAVLVVALAGCSKAYRDTSFAAQPELEAELHGHGKAQEGGEGEKQIGIASRMYDPDADDATAKAIPEEGGMDRTGIVFPSTAQPTSGAVATRLTPAERGGEAAPSGPAVVNPDAPTMPVPRSSEPEAVPQPMGAPAANGTMPSP